MKSDIYFCFGNEGHSQIDYSQIKSKIQIKNKVEKQFIKENNEKSIFGDKEKFLITKYKKNGITTNKQMKKMIAENKICINKLIPVSKKEEAKVYIYK